MVGVGPVSVFSAAPARVSPRSSVSAIALVHHGLQIFGDAGRRQDAAPAMDRLRNVLTDFKANGAKPLVETHQGEGETAALPTPPASAKKPLTETQVVQRSESLERAAKKHEHPERDEESTIGNKWGKRKWADERDEPDDEYLGLFSSSYRRFFWARP